MMINLMKSRVQMALLLLCLLANAALSVGRDLELTE